MNKIFCISDTWFNRPILQNQNLTSSEHNDIVINNWNKVVGKNDIVFVLGGLGIGDVTNILLRLNGKIHILNNFFTSDENEVLKNIKQYLITTIDEKSKSKIILEKNQIYCLNDIDIILSYFPLKDWYGKDTGTICVHGLTTDTDFDECNISCSTFKNDFTPINISTIHDKINQFRGII